MFFVYIDIIVVCIVIVFMILIIGMYNVIFEGKIVIV